MKPTPAQMDVLWNLHNNFPPGEHLRGMSDHGGFVRTMYALRRRGWIDSEDNLTQEGRNVYAKHRQTARPD